MCKLETATRVAEEQSGNLDIRKKNVGRILARLMLRYPSHRVDLKVVPRTHRTFFLRTDPTGRETLYLEFSLQSLATEPISTATLENIMASGWRRL